MRGLSAGRRLLKLLHPEAIPWPATALYNRLTSAGMIQRHYYEAVAAHILAHCSRGTLLDIGTGPGWLLCKLAAQAPALRLVGLDASTGMVSQAASNVPPATWLVAANAAALPLADSSVDAVVSTGSVHHWKQPHAALDEIHRVLRPGGRALLYDVVSDTPRSVMRELSATYGPLRLMLFWLHEFQEPFHSGEGYAALPRGSRFGDGETEFVAGMCCLKLTK